MHNWMGEGQEYNPEEAKDWGQCLSPLVVRLASRLSSRLPKRLLRPQEQV